MPNIVYHFEVDTPPSVIVFLFILLNRANFRTNLCRHLVDKLGFMSALDGQTNSLSRHLVDKMIFMSAFDGRFIVRLSTSTFGGQTTGLSRHLMDKTRFMSAFDGRYVGILWTQCRHMIDVFFLLNPLHALLDKGLRSL